jgi:predicted ATPase/DNA-binding CsgD family transcriptional regulator
MNMALVERLLSRGDVRLVTLTGPGGIGKTRLGLQVAAELADRFPDGVYFVNLAPISDPEFVVPAIAQALAVKEIAGQALLDQLKAWLREKQLLILLDNFEQVVSAAGQVAALLATCANLKMVVTSRMTLRVQAEHEFAVPPLALPDPKHLPDLGTLSQYEAVALFLQRAQAVKPEFQVTNASAPAITEICVRLDGLPLAIELAAARIKLLPPQALLARLGQRLDVLTGGARDAPARQQTLRDTIAWSYQLLDAAEQRLFQRLSVFAGGCTLKAVEAIGDTAGQVFERVASLIDKSMLQQTEEQGEEPRLLMLETIRAYGQACLEASGEEEVIRHAHAAYYLRLSETAEQEIEGPQQALWLERLEQEHDNLRTALSWWLEQGEAGQSMEMALRLGAALEQFWMIRGHYSEGRIFLERALAGREGVAKAVQAKALGTAAWLAINQSDMDRGEVLCKESLSLWQELGDTTGIALSLQRLAVVAWVRNNPAVARSFMEEALARWKEVSDKRHIGWVLTWLAYMAAQQGEYARALALGEESLVLYRELESKIGIAGSLGRLTEVLYRSQSDPARVRSLLEEVLALSREVGDKLGMAHGQRFAAQLALNQGDMTTARSLIEEALSLFREIGNREGMALSLALLARVEAGQGDHTAARTLYEESVTMASKGMGDKEALASCLEGLASLDAAQGELVRAARFWGAAERLRETIGTPIPPVERADYGRAVASARAQLGEKAFAKALAEGRTMSPEQVLATQGQVALPTPGERSSSPTTASPSTYPDGLTTREVEVLRVVAQGLTNEQVAERLVISPRTVDTHLTSIYSKIGVSSRSAATRYAIEHHLV